MTHIAMPINATIRANQTFTPKSPTKSDCLIRRTLFKATKLITQAAIVKAPARIANATITIVEGSINKMPAMIPRILASIASANQILKVY